MVHKLVKYIQSFKRESLFTTYFYVLRGRQTQGQPTLSYATWSRTVRHHFSARP